VVGLTGDTDAGKDWPARGDGIGEHGSPEKGLDVATIPVKVEIELQAASQGPLTRRM
jgi:hypothetical protein